MELSYYTLLVLTLITVVSGNGSSNSTVIYYNGVYVNTTDARVATSRSAHATAQSVYRNFFTKIILNADVHEIDLTILLDSSLSIGASNHKNAKFLLKTMIGVMKRNNFPSRVRTSMYSFSMSGYITREFAFGEVKFRELIRRSIYRSQFQNASYTHLTNALYWMDLKMQRYCRPTAKKVLIIATDGIADDDTMDDQGLNGPVSSLRDHNVETYVVALGEDLDLTRISVIASDSESEHIFYLKDTTYTGKVMEGLMDRMTAHYSKS
ncbi:collagen alpha-1(XIV) chain-like [Watersipora subatra]|uniref:collagen alpha-1(XIV) chain-like n=1 Tax=Watersipora subatra TaxID=2589382 RepID=UPI00355AD8B8